MNLVVHIFVFQLCWHVCVVGAAYGNLLIGPYVVAAGVLLFLLFHPRRKHEALVVVFVVIFGSASELALVKLGAFRFPEPALVPWDYPLWMSAVWAIFGTTLNSFFNWLARNYLMAAGLGFLGGMSSHYAGDLWGALSFGANPIPGLLMVGAAWAFIIPAVVYAAQSLKQRGLKQTGLKQDALSDTKNLAEES